MSVTQGLYIEKPVGYFNAARLDLLSMLPSGEHLRLLELGSGQGDTLRAAKESGLASYAVGIDLLPPATSHPAVGIVDQFIVGDLDDPAFTFPTREFDAIVCADVLEHLVDPWSVLKRAVQILRPGGWLATSIPNIRNHRAMRQIVFKGEFDYQPAGIFDRSHLRFFCRRNAETLVREAGLVVERVEENMGGYGLRHRLLDALTIGLLHDFFVFQFRILARKP